MVKDKERDVKLLRSKEQNHRDGAEDLRNYKLGEFKGLQEEDEENHAIYEEMIDKENAELERELASINQEI